MYLKVNGYTVVLERRLNPDFPEIAIVVPYRHQVESKKDEEINKLGVVIRDQIALNYRVPEHRTAGYHRTWEEVGLDTLTFYTSYKTELEIVDALRGIGFLVQQFYPRI